LDTLGELLLPDNCVMLSASTAETSQLLLAQMRRLFRVIPTQVYVHSQCGSGGSQIEEVKTVCID
jgi:hypothetical protein